MQCTTLRIITKRFSCKYTDSAGKEVELIIDNIGRSKIYGDHENMSCWCLNLRDGGQGFVKR